MLRFELVIDTYRGLLIFEVVPHLRPEIFFPLVMIYLEFGFVDTEGGEFTGFFFVFVMKHGLQAFFICPRRLLRDMFHVDGTECRANGCGRVYLTTVNTL